MFFKFMTIIDIAENIFLKKGRTIYNKQSSSVKIYTVIVGAPEKANKTDFSGNFAMAHNSNSSE